MATITVENTIISPVPNNQPVMDKNGMITQIWSGFFNQLWQRAGGANASSNSQLQSQIDAFVDSAANTIKGNNGVVATEAFDLTPAQVTAMLGVFSSTLQGLVPASSGGTTHFLRADGSWSTPVVFDYTNSSKVSTLSSAVTSATFTNFSNSPALTFAPAFTGKYKVYCSIPIRVDGSTTCNGSVRINKTSGTGTLVAESQAFLGTSVTSFSMQGSVYVESVYTLTATTSYVFDIQGQLNSGTNLYCDGVSAPFYMFAERVS